MSELERLRDIVVRAKAFSINFADHSATWTFETDGEALMFLHAIILVCDPKRKEEHDAE